MNLSGGNPKPHAVSKDIIIQELSDEILIYNSNTHKMLSLNKTAAAVWQCCDGRNTTFMITELVSEKIGLKVSGDVVLLSLETLRQNGLLKNEQKFVESADVTGVSRRDMIRRAGMTAVVSLPLITSLVAPTSAQAASNNLQPDGSFCGNDPTVCQSGCCSESLCLPIDACFII